MTLTITHTAADGTLLEGSRKGDGAWDAIKAAQATYRLRGWRYMPSIRAIGVSHSRDRAPNLGLIDATAAVLRDAGFDVEVQVDAAPRAMEEAEADRAERMDDRADALTAKAQRKAAESDARWKAGDEIAEHIPPGQPILVGHYSERGHRRALQRMDGHMRASLELGKEAELAAQRAASAEKHMQRREDPRRTLRRIEKLEADQRRAQRALDGHVRRHLRHDGTPFMVSEIPAAEGRHREQLQAQVAHLDEQLRYWREQLDQAKAEGRWNPIDLSAIKPGDLIQYWGGWSEVVRVNRKTVTVKTQYSWTQKAKVDEIRGHRTAEQIAAERAEAAAAIDLEELALAGDDAEQVQA